MRPPFRADHVGSLLRPHELHDLREQVRFGKASAAQLTEAEDCLIREAVKLQEDLGLQAITDGEFRRDWWHIDFIAGFDGVELRREGDSYHGVQFKAVEATPPTMFVTRKLRRTKPSMVPHFEFLRKVTTRGMPKFTMPSRACSIAGEGMVNFGTPLVTVFFRNSKCESMLGFVRRSLPEITM